MHRRRQNARLEMKIQLINLNKFETSSAFDAQSVFSELFFFDEVLLDGGFARVSEQSGALMCA